MSSLDKASVQTMAKRIALGQALAFLMSVTGVSTTKLVENNASYALLQSVTSYLFIFVVYFPFYLYLRYKYRDVRFANYAFLQKWYKYAILAVIDLEANYCVVMAYRYTNMVSIQLLDCFTVPCVLVLSYFILKMKFAVTHILGCVMAIGGLGMLIALDADGLSRNVGGDRQVLGDGLCLISSALYATSNVLTEWFIKPPKSQVLIAKRNDQAMIEPYTRGVERNEGIPSLTVAVEDDHYASNQDDFDAHGRSHEQPNVPTHVPVVENLAMMSLFACVFATIQFFALEWNSFSRGRAQWTGEDWLFQIVFGLTMLCVYTGMPTLFVVTSAAFTNISLLTADIYAIIWNVTVFRIYPTRIFFVPYGIIVVGILLYNLTDVVRIPFCARFNYLCGTIAVESSEQEEKNADRLDDRYYGAR